MLRRPPAPAAAGSPDRLAPPPPALLHFVDSLIELLVRCSSGDIAMNLSYSLLELRRHQRDEDRRHLSRTTPSAARRSCPCIRSRMRRASASSLVCSTLRLLQPARASARSAGPRRRTTPATRRRPRAAERTSRRRWHRSCSSSSAPCRVGSDVGPSCRLAHDHRVDVAVEIRISSCEPFSPGCRETVEVEHDPHRAAAA